ncbi:MAG: asparaginase domain-containing protein [Planctomycetota bacterium]
MRQIRLITTGGTIDKTYDERAGELVNAKSVVRSMLGLLRLEDTRVDVGEVLQKDSQLFTDADRASIVAAVRSALGTFRAVEPSGVVITHGTDTLSLTGETLLEEIGPLLQEVGAAVVLVGAMRPFEMQRSDALQNLTEALFASTSLPPGVWCVAHGRALAFPGVVKVLDRRTFVRREPVAAARKD